MELDVLLKSVFNLTEFVSKNFSKRKILLSQFENSFLLNNNKNLPEFFELYTLVCICSKLEISKNLTSANCFDDLMLFKPIEKIFQWHGKGESSRNRKLLLVKIISKYSKLFFSKTIWDKTENKKEKISLLVKLLNDAQTKTFIGVNEHNGIVYFNKEYLEELLNWIFTISSIVYFSEEKSIVKLKENMLLIMRFTESLKLDSVNSGYNFDKFSIRLKERIDKKMPKSSI